MKNEIEKLLSRIEKLKSNPSPENILPQNTYFLSETEVLCLSRKKGVSRYIYNADGLTLCAYSNGLIEASESNFSIFKSIPFFEEFSLSFFGGVKSGEAYTPVALFDAQRILGDTAERYVVFSEACAYYIADTKKVTFALRVFVDDSKHFHFSFSAINKTAEKISVYMFSSIEALLMTEADNFWNRLYKFGKRYDNSYILRYHENCLTVNTDNFGGSVEKAYHTVAKTDILGSSKTVLNADCLLSGVISEQSDSINTADFPVACDMFNVVLSGNEEFLREYDLSYSFTLEEAEKAIAKPLAVSNVERLISFKADALANEKRDFNIKFSDLSGKVNAGLLNRFLKSLQNQVNLCALGKSYAGPLLGMRDVMQQLESSIMWNPKESREKIINSLNFILEDGRPPRQFSFTMRKGDVPFLSLHKYVDQGVWIISTVYFYLAYTGDFSILDEVCSYYVAKKDNSGAEQKSEISDTVLEHLIKIMDFLVRNIDTEYKTNCLRILQGDWNDAVDGLGRTRDADKEFGSGVSVMASLQLYTNCFEMVSILKKIGKFENKISEYENVQRNLKEGLFKFAIDTNEQGEKRIIHGWGDKLSYKIGSFSDPDGVSRISSTAHSYWAVSGMINCDESLKPALIKAFDALSSKYGIRTFDTPFPKSALPYAGRIAKITPGTYENACVYVHGAMFAVLALFSIGQSERAWNELEKLITPSHENCTMTPFVMPNSYCDNSEFGMDGQSMGDWYTGSGTVVMKAVVRYLFGIKPDLDGITLATARVMPCKNAELSLVIKGKKVKIIYQNLGAGKRSYSLCGRELPSEYDTVAELYKTYIPENELTDDALITIID